MQASSRHSFGVPLVVSLLLHAGAFGLLLILSAPATTTPTPTPIIDTHLRDSPSGLILTLLPDDEKPDGQPMGPAHDAAGSGPTDFVATVAQLPVRSNTHHTGDSAPVVLPPPGPHTGHTADAAKNGAGGPGGLAKPGGQGGGALFAPAPTAKRVVYVVDRSGSMGQLDAYRQACGEVLANLSQLPADTHFQVVPYNSQAQPLCVNASLDLLPTNPDTLRQAESILSALRPTGWTNHLCGLQRGLLYAPDVLYFVTDADDLKVEDVRAITNLNHGRTVIHTIELHARHSAMPTGTLAQLAQSNGGTHRRVLLGE